MTENVRTRITKRMAELNIDINTLSEHMDINKNILSQKIDDYNKFTIFEIQQLISILKIKKPVSFFYN